MSANFQTDRARRILSEMMSKHARLHGLRRELPSVRFMLLEWRETPVQIDVQLINIRFSEK